jgi:hypothetical protein
VEPETFPRKQCTDTLSGFSVQNKNTVSNVNSSESSGNYIYHLFGIILTTDTATVSLRSIIELAN